MDADQSLQHADDMLGAKARRDLDRQAFAGVLVDDRQTFDLLFVGAGIEHEIIGPDVIDGRGRQRLGRCQGTCRLGFHAAVCL